MYRALLTRFLTSSRTHRRVGSRFRGSDSDVSEINIQERKRPQECGLFFMWIGTWDVTRPLRGARRPGDKRCSLAVYVSSASSTCTEAEHRHERGK
jgi:hypothetical protein